MYFTFISGCAKIFSEEEGNSELADEYFVYDGEGDYSAGVGEPMAENTFSSEGTKLKFFTQILLDYFIKIIILR